MTTDDPSTHDRPSTVQKRALLASYLRQKARDGEFYFKSKFAAEELGLSSKEIGALMIQLDDSTPDLEIEKWSNARATTWRVTRTQ